MMGQVVIPCKWNRVSIFSEDLAMVQDANYLFGFIDKNGQVVIPCKWINAFNFSEGVAWVMADNGKEFLINETGQVVEVLK